MVFEGFGERTVGAVAHAGVGSSLAPYHVSVILLGRASLGWEVLVIEPARSWLHGLRKSDRATLRQIANAIDVLAIEGPNLGRPLVDSIRGTRIANLKELRPGSTGKRRCGSCS
jgi:hypothetical protein